VTTAFPGAPQRLRRNLEDRPMATKRIKLPTCLTVREAAEHLSVSEKTIRRWIWCGALRHHRLGASIRIAEEDLAAFVAACRH
jgi:excisionase family DNA binding protein